jgi:hypothetical protein
MLFDNYEKLWIKNEKLRRKINGTVEFKMLLAIIIYLLLLHFLCSFHLHLF